MEGSVVFLANGKEGKWVFESSVSAGIRNGQDKVNSDKVTKELCHHFSTF